MNRIENIFGIMPDQANQCQHNIWIGLISEKKCKYYHYFSFYYSTKKNLDVQSRKMVLKLDTLQKDN